MENTSGAIGTRATCALAAKNNQLADYRRSEPDVIRMEELSDNGLTDPQAIAQGRARMARRKDQTRQLNRSGTWGNLGGLPRLARPPITPPKPVPQTRGTALGPNRRSATDVGRWRSPVVHPNDLPVLVQSFGKIAVGRLKYALEIGRLAEQMNGDRTTTILSNGTGIAP